jgi:hypothetical protein
MYSKKYYEELKSDLIKWKSKIEKMLSQFDNLSCDDKDRVSPYISEFSKIVSGLSEKIERLRRHCSNEYPSYSGEWKFTSGKEEKKEDGTEHSSVWGGLDFEPGEIDKSNDEVLEDANPT